MIQSEPQLDVQADEMVNGDGPPPAVGDTTLEPCVRRAARRGAAWTVAGYGSILALRFIFNLILTRLVAPKIFGIMASINILIQALHMFSDLGISQCVTRHDRGDEPTFLNTAWTIQACRGIVLWCIALALAWPTAEYCREPALAWLIPIASLTAILDGLQSSAIFTLNRRLSRGRLVLLELVPYALVTAVAVAGIGIVAENHPGGQNHVDVQHTQVMILVWANVAIFAIRMTASYWLMPGRPPRFGLEFKAAGELLHFGGWVFVSTACGFLATYADQILIPRLKDMAALGIYRVASQLAALPAQFVATLCAALVFPLYSRLFREDSGAGVASVHRTVGVVSGWLVSGLIVAGPTFIDCLYRGEYREAANYVQLLAVAAWFTMLQSTSEAVLLARGHAKLMALAQVLKLAVLVPLMSYGYHWHGMIGLVIGYGLAEVIRYVAIVIAVHSLGQPVAWDDLWLTGLIAATVVGAYAVRPVAWGAIEPFARSTLETLSTYFLNSEVMAKALKWVRLFLQAISVTAIWAVVYGTLHRWGRVGLGAPRSEA